MRSPPGAEHHYSNAGDSLLAAIVEEASGVGYEEFLAEHLFAAGEPQDCPFEHPWAADGPYWNLRGNGGLLSTARDRLRWHRAFEGDQVLDRGAKAELFRPFVLEEPGGDTSYGYGWVIQASPYGTVAAHDGGNAWSYGELIRLLDQGMLVFYVTNQARTRPPARTWSAAPTGWCAVSSRSCCATDLPTQRRTG